MDPPSNASAAASASSSTSASTSSSSSSSSSSSTMSTSSSTHHGLIVRPAKAMPVSSTNKPVRTSRLNTMQAGESASGSGATTSTKPASTSIKPSHSRSASPAQRPTSARQRSVTPPRAASSKPTTPVHTSRPSSPSSNASTPRSGPKSLQHSTTVPSLSLTMPAPLSARTMKRIAAGALSGSGSSSAAGSRTGTLTSSTSRKLSTSSKSGASDSDTSSTAGTPTTARRSITGVLHHTAGPSTLSPAINSARSARPSLSGASSTSRLSQPSTARSVVRPRTASTATSRPSLTSSSTTKSTSSSKKPSTASASKKPSSVSSRPSVSERAILDDIQIIEDWLSSIKNSGRGQLLQFKTVITKMKSTIFTPLQVKRARAQEKAGTSTTTKATSTTTKTSTVRSTTKATTSRPSTSSGTSSAKPSRPSTPGVDGESKAADAHAGAGEAAGYLAAREAESDEDYGDLDEGEDNDFDSKLQTFIKRTTARKDEAVRANGAPNIGRGGIRHSPDVVFENGRWIPVQESKLMNDQAQESQNQSKADDSKSQTEQEDEEEEEEEEEETKVEDDVDDDDDDHLLSTGEDGDADALDDIPDFSQPATPSRGPVSASESEAGLSSPNSTLSRDHMLGTPPSQFARRGSSGGGGGGGSGRTSARKEHEDDFDALDAIPDFDSAPPTTENTDGGQHVAKPITIKPTADQQSTQGKMVAPFPFAGGSSGSTTTSATIHVRANSSSFAPPSSASPPAASNSATTPSSGPTLIRPGSGAATPAAGSRVPTPSSAAAESGVMMLKRAAAEPFPDELDFDEDDDADAPNLEVAKERLKVNDGDAAKNAKSPKPASRMKTFTTLPPSYRPASTGALSRASSVDADELEVQLDDLDDAHHSLLVSPTSTPSTNSSLSSIARAMSSACVSGNTSDADSHPAHGGGATTSGVTSHTAFIGKFSKAITGKTHNEDFPDDLDDLSDADFSDDDRGSSDVAAPVTMFLGPASRDLHEFDISTSLKSDLEASERECKQLLHGRLAKLQSGNSFFTVVHRHLLTDPLSLNERQEFVASVSQQFGSSLPAIIEKVEAETGKSGKAGHKRSRTLPDAKPMDA